MLINVFEWLKPVDHGEDSGLALENHKQRIVTDKINYIILRFTTTTIAKTDISLGENNDIIKILTFYTIS